MKKSYCCLLIFLLCGSMSYAQTGTSADTLHDASLTRPLSIVNENPRWNTTSTDLFTAWISNGLYGFYGPQPQVMLNGIPVNATFFGWQNLNMIPMLVQNIDQATSQFAAGVCNQTPSGSGMINFETKVLEKGLTARAFYFTGNETKDPGPWAYDSLKMSPNIDRWGPDSGVLLAYKTANWYAKGLYAKRFQKPRDLAQNIRLHFTNSFLGTNETYVNHPIYIKSKSGLLKAGFNNEHWNVASRFILSENEDYLFLQSFAREVPVQMEYRQWAIQARYNNGPWHIKARYLRDYKALSKRVPLHTYIFDWEQHNNTIALSGGYQANNLKITPGLVFKQLNISAPGIQNIKDNIVTLFLKTKTAVNNNVNFYLNSYLDYHHDVKSKSISFKLGANIKLTEHYVINPELLYAESNPIRQHSLIYWVNRGYTFAQRLGITTYKNPQVLENEALSIKMGNKFIFGNFSLNIIPQYIKNYRLNIPWQEVRYLELTNTLPGIFTLTQHSGERFKFLVTINHSYLNLFQQSLTIYLQQTISGSARYKKYFRQVPNTKIKYQLDITPVDGLQLSINALYRSSTKWFEYAAVDGETYHLPAGIPIGDFSRTFNIVTPSFINLGLSVRKWVLDRHLSLQIGIQNILDQEVRYHPIGASLYPIVNFKITARF